MFCSFIWIIVLFLEVIDRQFKPKSSLKQQLKINVDDKVQVKNIFVCCVLWALFLFTVAKKDYPDDDK